MIRAIALLIFIALAPVALAQSAFDQMAWDETVAAARKEGKVVLLAPPEPTARKLLPELFHKRYGINLEYISGRSSATAERLRAERSAGIYSADVVIAGIQTMSKRFYQDKMLAPLKPLLVLPEVIDGSNWKNGKLWFVDPEQQFVLRLFNTVTPVLTINTDKVKPDEMRSSRDLINPKWKGKIAFMDPTVSGTGSNHAAQLDMLFGDDFMKALLIAQKPAITRDRHQLTDWVVRGTYPISFGAEAGEIDRLQRQGFPLRAVYELSDMPGYLSGGDQLAVLDHAPHPNATKVFANWIATKEGSDAYGHAFSMVPARADTDADLPREAIPRPGVNYFDPYDWNFTVTTKEQLRKRINGLMHE